MGVSDTFGCSIYGSKYLYTILCRKLCSSSVLPNGDYPTNETVDFTIETTLPDTLEALEDYFNRYINVFDLNVIATDSVDEANLLHAAYVLAEYLDNNEDGIVDDTTILNALLDNNGTVVITEDEDELEQIIDEIE